MKRRYMLLITILLVGVLVAFMIIAINTKKLETTVNQYENEHVSEVVSLPEESVTDEEQIVEKPVEEKVTLESAKKKNDRINEIMEADISADERTRLLNEVGGLTDEELALLDMSLDEDNDESINYELEEFEGATIDNEIITKKKDDMGYDEYMVQLALYYVGGVPYAENGYDWSDYFVKQESCDNVIQGAYGLGNKAFVQSLYMYTFGKVPSELKDMDSLASTLKKASYESLKTGDIALCIRKNGTTDYAVCIGEKQGRKLFIHCVNTEDASFGRGVTKICYNKDEFNHYLNGAEPVSFTEFYVSPVTDWSNGL